MVNGASDDQIEVGMTGREGVTGLPILLGSDRSPNKTYVQVAGHGRRIKADDLRQAMDESSSLRALLLNFVQFFLIQASQTALANARFKIEERLARWLLMAQDRVDLPAMPLTHEFLSIMLGVRRAGVTDAIHALVGRGMIRSERGQIEVIDRQSLIEWANGCYGVPEREYERLFG
jgi:CRP-like cAMP-binding protein